MYSRLRCLVMLFLMFGLSGLNAQNTLDEIRLFQTFFKDAPIANVPYGQAGLQFSDYDGFSSISLGAKGGYVINPELEVGGSINFVNWSPEKGDSQSGISDLLVTGRYLVLAPGKSKLVATTGGYITLPIGKKEIGASKLNFGAFGAARFPLDNGFVITGCLGLDFLETTKYETDFTKGKIEEKTEHEFSLLLGAGGIYPLNEQLHIIGELNIQTEGDYMLLSGGVDYKLQMGSRVRAALGLGLDDGAPDIKLMAGFLHSF